MCAAGDPSPFSTASAQDPDYRYGPDPMLEMIAQVRLCHWEGCLNTHIRAGHTYLYLYPVESSCCSQLTCTALRDCSWSWSVCSQLASTSALN